MSGGTLGTLQLHVSTEKVGPAHDAPNQPVSNVGIVVIRDLKAFNSHQSFELDRDAAVGSPTAFTESADKIIGDYADEETTKKPHAASELDEGKKSQGLKVSVEDGQPGAGTPPRQWLVRLKVSLSGKPMRMSDVAKRVEIISEQPHILAVSRNAALSTTFVHVYTVTEMAPYRLPDCLLRLPCLVVRLTPLYHPAILDVYRLDSKLADIVGHSYLAHPKFAISMVLEYAKSHQLETEKLVVCDPYLSSIVGCKYMRLTAVWNHLSPLMRRVEEEPLEQDVCLLGEDSEVSMQVQTDAQMFAYPPDWKRAVGQPCGRSLKRSATRLSEPESEEDVVAAPAPEAAPLVKLGKRPLGGTFKRHPTLGGFKLSEQDGTVKRLKTI